MKKSLIQANELTQGRYNMPTLEKRVLYAIMVQINDDDPPTKFYKVSIADLTAASGTRFRREELEKALP